MLGETSGKQAGQRGWPSEKKVGEGLMATERGEHGGKLYGKRSMKLCW